MKRREISEEEIRRVYENPQQKIPLASGREIWQNKTEIGGREYILRVIVEVTPKPLIVTVYKSSKVKKYWRSDK